MIHIGVLGEQLSHSLSPDINRYLMKEEQIQGSYHVLEIEKEHVARVPDIMRILNIRGLNVTIPYKETLMEYVDEVSLPAKEIGALNTIYLKDGRTYGYNTDYTGILGMFSKGGISLAGKEVLILGNGGAARAVIVALHHAQAAKVTVAGRRKEVLEALNRKFPFIETVTYNRIEGGDIIINATPVGMYPKTGVSIVGREVLKRFAVAADLVYNPLETEFLRLAKAEGLQVITGLRMLIDQAVGSHEIWFNRKIKTSISDDLHERLLPSVAAAQD